ncbi:hypothetical protein [Asanoa iriomotensis]|uniref:CHRD domain-containing protein n=1 Tax=Asanoa iriomotensis TaxID=234613 RepID=A0ABQ4C081_9ACTN|nr:hypothetical protein [Asanoa iriomotensis]GIF56183.1 hypothetical protein Air01nite_22780 [Asanoa iriomotensis]
MSRSALVKSLAVAWVVLLLGAANAACAGQATGGPVGVSPSSPPGLSITGSSASHDAGTFVHAASTITFEATTETPVRTTFTLSVNGKTFTASKDTEKATSRWSGGGAVLREDDGAALGAFSDALSAAWSQPATIPPHRDLALRMAALLAQAPLGVAIGDQVAPGPQK